MSLKAADTLGKGLNKLEQYNRRENVEIIGLPDSKKNVELKDVVIDILRRIGVYHLEKWEIVGCHGPKKNPEYKSSNVIIRFVNRKRANQCLQNHRYLKRQNTRIFYIYMKNAYESKQQVLSKDYGHIMEVSTLK